MMTRLPLTKYHQIYLVLREQLQEGRFAQGMPAEMELDPLELSSTAPATSMR